MYRSHRNIDIYQRFLETAGANIGNSQSVTAMCRRKTMKGGRYISRPACANLLTFFKPTSGTQDAAQKGSLLASLISAGWWCCLYASV